MVLSLIFDLYLATEDLALLLELVESLDSFDVVDLVDLIESLLSKFLCGRFDGRLPPPELGVLILFINHGLEERG